MGTHGNGAAPQSPTSNGAAAHDASLEDGNGHAPPGGQPGRRPDVVGALWPTRVPAPPPRTAADESVDVGALARAIGRGWRTLVVGTIVGILVGAALAAFFPPRYRGAASVLVRNANDPAGSILSKIGLSGDLAGAATGGSLGGMLKSPLETELQLLESRDLLGHVVDSLALQARVSAPRGVPARALFAAGPIRGSFRHRDVVFTRAANGTYRAEDADGTALLVPGRPGAVPGVGPVTLVDGPLPERFDVRMSDREDAITETDQHLTVEKKGGELVEVRYTGRDSLTAAAVPNAIVAAYLEQRRTVDRGINQRRYEFMVLQADSAARQLAVAEEALRREQEASGVLDPETSGKSALEAIQQIRSQYVEMDAERQAAHALIDVVQRGSLSPRQLAAFPSFLRAPAINSILSQITTLETERTRLLGTRTERDPDVAVLSQSIGDLDRSLVPLATTYAGSLDRQVSELEGQQRAIETRLDALPGQAEGGIRRQRDVKRLSQTVLGLQAQIIDARLSALSEGGQVRAVDAAVAPKRPLFPRAAYTIPGGLVLGLVGAIAFVLGRGAWSSRVHTAVDAERASGLPVVSFHGGQPLLLGLGARTGTLLAVAADPATVTRPIADVLAAQARARGQHVVALDARDADASDHRSMRDVVERAEADYDALYVAAPPITDARTAGLLDAHRAVAVVAREGVTTRLDLAEAAQTLARLGAPVVGVVLTSRGPGRGGRAGVTAPAVSPRARGGAGPGAASWTAAADAVRAAAPRVGARAGVRPVRVLQFAITGLVITNLGRAPILFRGPEWPVLVNDLLVGVSLLACAAACLQARRLRVDALVGVAAVFACVGAGAALWAAQKYALTTYEVLASLAYMGRWLALFGLYVGVINVARDADADALWGSLERTALRFAAFGVFQVFAFTHFAQQIYPSSPDNMGWDDQGRRLVSTILDPNFAGMFMLFPLLIYAAQLAFGERVTLWKPLLLLAAILMTVSRGTFLAMIIGLAFVVAVRGVTRGLAKTAGVVLLVATPLVPVLVRFAASFNKFTIDGSAMARVDAWLHALTVVADNPVFGIGFNTYLYVQRAYGWQMEGRSLASLDGGLLFITVMTGVVGLATYVVLLGLIAAGAVDSGVTPARPRGRGVRARHRGRDRRARPAQRHGELVAHAVPHGSALVAHRHRGTVPPRGRVGSARRARGCLSSPVGGRARATSRERCLRPVTN